MQSQAKLDVSRFSRVLKVTLLSLFGCLMFSSVLHPAGRVSSLKVGENQRYLVDENNAPFLMQGDGAWSLIVELNATEVEQHLNNRHYSVGGPRSVVSRPGAFLMPDTPAAIVVNLDWTRRYRRLAQSEMLVTRPTRAFLSFCQLFPHGIQSFQQAIIVSAVKGKLSDFAPAGLEMHQVRAKR
jgi:hypothetical protein